VFPTVRLRKVAITGLIMFVSPGSLFQLVVALLFSLGFGFAAAWFQPYVFGAANIFKVGVEMTRRDQEMRSCCGSI
jgi:hypothetical protein